MSIRMRGVARFVILAGVLALVPVQVSSDGVSYADAAANNAGGNGKGKGQGAAKAGTNGGGSVASAGGLAKGQANPLHASGLGRLNALIHASSNAWLHAKGNSPMGIITGEYATALKMFSEPSATELPTIEDLGAILAKVANKDEIPAEAIDLIHQRMLEVRVIQQTDLDQASALLAPPSLDATAPAPTFAELLTEQANLAQTSETNQGLDPIY